MTGRHTHSERGAAAVEFALVVPLLIALVFGIAEFGRAWFIQSTLAGAAREGARAAAISNGAAGTAAAQAALVGFTGTTIAVTACPTPVPTTPPIPNAVVTIKYTL